MENAVNKKLTTCNKREQREREGKAKWSRQRENRRKGRKDKENRDVRVENKMERSEHKVSKNI